MVARWVEIKGERGDAIIIDHSLAVEDQFEVAAEMDGNENLGG